MYQLPLVSAPWIVCLMVNNYALFQYTSCTTASDGDFGSDGRPWCSVTSNLHLNHLWGYCTDNSSPQTPGTPIDSSSPENSNPNNLGVLDPSLLHPTGPGTVDINYINSFNHPSAVAPNQPGGPSLPIAQPIAPIQTQPIAPIQTQPIAPIMPVEPVGPLDASKNI